MQPEQQKQRVRLAPLVVAAVVGVALVLLFIVAEDSPAPARDCTWLARPATEAAGSGSTVFLVDRSASMRPADTNGNAAVDAAATLGPALDRAVAAGDFVSVGSFDGSAATVAWEVTGWRTASPSRNDDNREDDRAEARACVAERVRRAAGKPAERAGSDVLGALAAGRERLGPAEAGPRRIVLLTDGLANLGCADLRRAAIGDTDDVELLVLACRGSGELVDLDGIAVEILGVGHPGKGHPTPASVQLAWLGRVWEELCKASGTSSCAVSTAAPALATGTPPPHAPEEVSDPTVEFPAPKRVVAPCTSRTDVPSHLLFATGSAELLPGATSALGPVLDSAWSGEEVEVLVEGHTDSRGTDRYNQGLSERRAKAVAGVLRRLGITSVSARGRGESAPRCHPEFRADGSPDRRALACNRRVEITVTVTACLGR